VKRTQLLATFLGVLSLVMSGCGTGDKIASVNITAVGASGGVINLSGLGSTLQLTVTANYTSGKQVNETNFATFTVVPLGYDNNTLANLQAPPNTLTINATGMVTAVTPAVCTWVSETGVPATPGWAYTGSYMITATYRGFVSQPIYIPLASAASNQTGMNGQCGPSSS
jgi:hypothetical protein